MGQETLTLASSLLVWSNTLYKISCGKYGGDGKEMTTPSHRKKLTPRKDQLLTPHFAKTESS